MCVCKSLCLMLEHDAFRAGNQGGKIAVKWKEKRQPGIPKDGLRSMLVLVALDLSGCNCDVLLKS